MKTKQVVEKRNKGHENKKMEVVENEKIKVLTFQNFEFSLVYYEFESPQNRHISFDLLQFSTNRL